MSSVVKKSSHFAPKLKKKQIRRNAPLETPQGTPSAGLPPLSSQAPLSSQLDPGVPTPPVTQQPEKAASPSTNLLKYSIDATSAIRTPQPSQAELEAEVDPMDKSRRHRAASVAVADDDDDHDNDSDASDRERRDLQSEQDDLVDEANDIFASAQPHQRRRSSVATRRLSGISGLRSGSFSAAGSVGPPGAEDVSEPPVTIGIPMSRPSKRRRSSAAAHGRNTKRASKDTPVLVVAPPSSQIFREDDEIQAQQEELHQAQERIHTAEQDKDIVVGIDAVTGKFRKYRKSEDVEGLDHLPVAPADLITSINNILQLPRRVSKEDERYFALIGVQANAMTMAELCKPMLQIGATSDKFEMAEAAKVKLLQKRDLRRDARRKARIERISYEKALRELQDANGIGEEERDADSKKKFVLQESDDPKPTTSLKMNVVDGKLQVDAESTVVGNQRSYDSSNQKVELENPFENPITSSSYTKLTHTDAWTTEELIQFYNALSTWGTDFTFIAQLFPYRTRRQVKRKFILEEKRSPELVELALRRRLPPDFNDYCAAISADTRLKTLEEFRAEMNSIKEEHEMHMEEINAERERAIEEDLEANRKREMEYRTGSKMSARERKENLRRNEIVVGTVDDVKKSREELEATG